MKEIHDSLENSRLNDFKQVLTYLIITKIQYHFNSDYNAYYSVTGLWKKWTEKKIKYDSKIYSNISKFNDISLSSHSVQSIFGKDKNNKWIQYKQLIDSDSDLKVLNKGSYAINIDIDYNHIQFKTIRRFQFENRYMFNQTYIKNIFENKELLKQVTDIYSGFYTKRQIRLIKTQILQKKSDKQLTNKEFANKFIEQIIHFEKINNIAISKNLTIEQYIEQYIQEKFKDKKLSIEQINQAIELYNNQIKQFEKAYNQYIKAKTEHDKRNQNNEDKLIAEILADENFFI